ncbi:hypothetical protein [Ktedonobacter racemifer]|uniref:Uncharacterized protein n=1 Tax=Ktedonobacter racemifer DSM 44963 TaxID=485913 RepID=D6TCD9_KTERA|nr:hypothetical protein [Ktedonobacter racemifer]EFH89956.1 hypothetical protein Krac_11545 [Ktedonobacter racemifer DSM 44963]
MFHPECWKKYDCLVQDMNAIQAAIAFADVQQDEETTLRCMRQTLGHMRVMQSALSYFIGDLEETLKDIQSDYDSNCD